MYGEKIKTIRELRGFSQEFMANKLGIAQNTYSKLETGQTKLNADALRKIAELLGVSPIDILSSQPTIIKFEPDKKTSEIDHTGMLFTYQREFVEKMVASKDIEIQHLKEIIQVLIKDKELMLAFINTKSGNSSDRV